MELFSMVLPLAKDMYSDELRIVLFDMWLVLDMLRVILLLRKVELWIALALRKLPT